MTPNGYRLFLYLASYARWESDPHYPQRLFGCLEDSGLRPQRLDERDPPRRAFIGGEEDVKFWFAKQQGMGRRVFADRGGQLPSYNLAAHWVDRGIELARVRGDYHSLYVSVIVDDTTVDAVVSLWRELCRCLHPLHAFLDTEDAYNVRAHDVSPDGHVTKLTGWYLRRLPGFFAHNYFGDVYLRRWGTAVTRIPASLTTTDAHGLFIAAPSGLDLAGRANAVYSPDDLAVIQALGPEWFRLPERTDRPVAPSPEEFLAATPNPS